MTNCPLPSLRHLARLTDGVGLFEHARLAEPRRDLGYCTDDAGRALAAASVLATDPAARRIATTTLDFLTRAATGTGSFRLRCDVDGRWLPDAPSDDATGRALFGLGTAAAHAPWEEVRAGARRQFDAAVGFRSAHPRARAYAALGAVEVLAAHPGHAGAARLASAAIDLLSPCRDDPLWPWPEPRLTYANALLPDAALAVAVAAGRDADMDRALALLAWLVRAETVDDRFSFTPVGGRGPGDHRPAFDQQPIEAAAMADACARAFAVTGDLEWARAVERTAGWFLGHNDVGATMFDPVTGGGFDGLEPGGVNRNQGAESTLAFVTTMARAHAVRGVQTAAWSPAARAASR